MNQHDSPVPQEGFNSKIRMEEEKLLQIKEMESTGGDKNALAECCNNLAKFYFKHKRYKDAVIEYESAASIYKDLGLLKKWGMCCGVIAELYFILKEYDKASKFVNSELDVAKDHLDVVEQQNALTTLGSILLCQGQKAKNERKAKTALWAAEKAFRESYALSKKAVHFNRDPQSSVTMKILMEKQARLYLNLGIVQKHIGDVDKALLCIKKTLDVIYQGMGMKTYFEIRHDPTVQQDQDLVKVLHECYMEEASVNCDKKDYDAALGSLSNAMTVAKKLHDKEVSCKTLSAQADILCKMSDYKGAKNVLIKAWIMKPLDKAVNEDIVSNLKVVTEMCNILKLVESTEATDHQTLKDLYDKLGDGACYLRNDADALKYYHKVLEHAQLAGDDETTFSPIYASLYNTYEEMGRYDEALVYRRKDFELNKDDEVLKARKLFNMAELIFMAKKPYEQIEEVCLENRRICDECLTEDSKMMILERLMKYQEHWFELDELERTKEDLTALGYDWDSHNANDDKNKEKYIFSNSLGDNINLEDLIAEVEPTKKRVQRIPKNKKMKPGGGTPLHNACLSGHKARVIDLIAKGRSVNEKNEDGWTPLQVACGYGRIEIAKILIENGANINEANNKCEGDTPLLNAANFFQLGVIELLLEKGADLTATLDTGETALDLLKKYRLKFGLTKHGEEWYNNIVDKITNGLNCNSNSKTSDNDSLPRAADTEREDSDDVVDTSHDVEVTEENLSGDNDQSERRTNKQNCINNNASRKLGKDSKKVDCEARNVKTKGNKKSRHNDDEERINDVTFTDEDTENIEIEPTKKRVHPIPKNRGTKPGGVPPLHNACVSGHKSRVKELIARGHSVNEKDEEGWTPLQLACGYGRTEIARILIENGANINEAHHIGDCTPLLNAACYGHLRVIELLLEKGADLTAILNKGETALDLLKEYRLKSKLPKLVQELYNNIINKITNGLNRNSNSKMSENDSQPSASDTEREDIADDSEVNTRLLEDSDAVVDTSHDVEMTEDNLSGDNDQSKTKNLKQNRTNNNASRKRTKGNKADCEESNVKTKGNKKSKHNDDEERINDVTLTDEDTEQIEVEPTKKRVQRIPKNRGTKSGGGTPLHNACVSGDKAQVIDLIAKGCSVNERNEDGWTPLQVACGHGRIEIAKILIENGANINEANHKAGGRTALLNAASFDQLGVIELLLEKGADLTATLDTGETALDILKKYRLKYPNVTERGKKWYNNVIDKLTNGLNCNSNSKTSDNDSLPRAADTEREDSDAVVDTSHDVEMTEDNLSGDEDQSKTRTSKQNRPNNNASHKLAKENKKVDCEESHVKIKGDKKSKHNDDEEHINDVTLTDEDTAKIEVEPIKKRVQRKPKNRGTKPGGGTPMHNACLSGHKSRVIDLIAKGHSVNERNEGGWTPLQVACGYGRIEIARILIENGANINEANNKRGDCTPLLNAASYGQLGVIELLLEKGADLTATLDDGETAVDLLKAYRLELDNISESGEEWYNNVIDKITNKLNRSSNSKTSDNDSQPSAADTERTGVANDSEVNTRSLEDSDAVVHTSDDVVMNEENLSGDNDQSKTKTSKQNRTNNNASRKRAKDSKKLDCKESNVKTKGNKKSKQNDDEERINDVTFTDEDTEQNEVEPTKKRVQPIPKNRGTKPGGGTPLHNACRYRQNARLIDLIAKGYSVNEKNEDGWTPLHVACKYGRIEIAKILIENGANINEANHKSGGHTALLNAASFYELGVIELLLEKGADVSATLDTGETALDLLKKYRLEYGLSKHEEEWYNNIVDKITNGLNCNSNSKTSDNDSLPRAADTEREDSDAVVDTSHDVEMTEENLSGDEDQSKTRTSKQNRPNNNASHKLAKENKKVDCEESHVKIKGDKKSKHNDDEEHINDVTLTDEDTAKIEVEPIKKRVQRKPKNRGTKPGGGTPMHNACLSGHKSRVIDLIAKGHSVNERNEDGWTPLQVACGFGRIEIARILIENGANINEANNKRGDCTPLLNAASYGQLGVIELLLEKGADLTATLDDGETAVDLLKAYRLELDNISESGEEWYNNVIDKITNKLNRSSNSKTSDNDSQPSAADTERKGVANDSEVNTRSLEDSDAVVDTSHDVEMTEDNLPGDNDQSKTKTSKQNPNNNASRKRTKDSKVDCEESNVKTKENKKSKHNDDEERINDVTFTDEDTEQNNTESVPSTSAATLSEAASQSEAKNKLMQRLKVLMDKVPDSDLNTVWEQMEFVVTLHSSA